MKYIICFLTVFLICSQTTFAQDVHYTRFYDAPLHLNPARAGDYLGTFKIGGIFRDQNYNLSNVYVTPDAYVDAPLFRGFAKSHWVGLGVNFLQDEAGVGGLKTSAITGALAYHIGNKDMSNSVSIGVSVGYTNRSVSDKAKFIFEEFLISGASTDANKITDQPIKYYDISAGVQVNMTVAESGNMKAGLSLGHLNNPKYSLLSGGNRLPLRTTLYLTLDAPVSERFNVLPAAYASMMRGNRDIALQMAGAIKINPLKNFRLIAGVGYRFSDAFQFLAGLDIKNTKLGLSYDLTHNPIKPTGGFEVSLSQVVMIYKKPKDNPVILCPRL